MTNDNPSPNPLPQGKGAHESASSSPRGRRSGREGLYIERLSPNVTERPAGVPIDMLVLHYTGMTSATAAIDRLTDAASMVSCHWLIEEDGTTWRLAREEERACHAGVSFWAGDTNINDRSIGIELVNPGHQFGYRPFPEAQMRSLEALGRKILARHPIPAWRVTGHSDVAPKRKQDPGELFDWARLARAGLGVWPDPHGSAADGDPVEGLTKIGYADSSFETVVAFQRHFLPSRIDGVVDAETRQRIAQVAVLVPSVRHPDPAW